MFSTVSKDGKAGRDYEKKLWSTFLIKETVSDQLTCEFIADVLQWVIKE